VTRSLSIAAMLWCAMAAAAAAHHSFSAEFDINKPITLTGTVTMVRWSNPHGWIYVDVKDANGKVVNWAFETAAANQLYRRGWRPEDIPSGTVVIVDGWLARNGTPMANTDKITLPDGRKLLGAAASVAPPSP
jgi:hypothetical protein